MNQFLRGAVYATASEKEMDYVCENSGMNDEEKIVFKMICKGFSELYIQNELGLSAKSYKAVEGQIRRKTLVCIHHCINFTILNES